MHTPSHRHYFLIALCAALVISASELRSTEASTTQPDAAAETSAETAPLSSSGQKGGGAISSFFSPFTTYVKGVAGMGEGTSEYRALFLDILKNSKKATDELTERKPSFFLNAAYYTVLAGVLIGGTKLVHDAQEALDVAQKALLGAQSTQAAAIEDSSLVPTPATPATNPAETKTVSKRDRSIKNAEKAVAEAQAELKLAYKKINRGLLVLYGLNALSGFLRTRDALKEGPITKKLTSKGVERFAASPNTLYSLSHGIPAAVSALAFIAARYGAEGIRKALVKFPLLALPYDILTLYLYIFTFKKVNIVGKLPRVFKGIQIPLYLMSLVHLNHASFYAGSELARAFAAGEQKASSMYKNSPKTQKFVAAARNLDPRTWGLT